MAVQSQSGSKAHFMRVGIIIPRDEPFSMRVYRRGVTQVLEHQGVEFVDLRRSPAASRAVDLHWDYAAWGGRPPLAAYRRSRTPCVVTQHGARVMTLPLRKTWPSLRERARVLRVRWQRKWGWQCVNKGRFHYIAVSHYTKEESIRTLGLPESRIVVAHHGVDHALFRPAGGPPGAGPRYFVHVSQYQTVKNLDRAIEAYRSLPESIRPPFIVNASQYGRAPRIAGLTVSAAPVNDAELVRLYQGALALLFPSLHEGFGFPLVEAMACGCPALTSNVTSCPEIIGDAGLAVDPWSVEAIAGGMRRIAEDCALRDQLAQKALTRAREFTWEASAAIHRDVFDRAVRESQIKSSL